MSARRLPFRVPGRRQSVPQRLLALDRRLAVRLVRVDDELLDATLPRLARVADHSKLWVGIGLAAAVGGGRFGRRGALRGVLALAATSALVNGGLKRVFRRVRPEPAAVRLLTRIPSSASFPSGHAASGFAFATGMTLEKPAVGVPLFGLAGAVAYSRVHTGVHFPGDVLVGAAIGSGIALGTLRWWPPAPKCPAPARMDSVAVGPFPDGDGLLVVVNPSSGPAIAPDRAQRLRELLPAAHVVVVEDGDRIEEVLRREGPGYRALGIAGGDGSVSAAVEIAQALGKPLAVLPAGTMNNFAKDLGISSLEDAVAAVGPGRAAAVDVATIDGRSFVNSASFGAYVDLIRIRERLEGRLGKWPALVVALARVVRRARPIRVEIDGQTRLVWLVLVGNCRYRPEGFAASWRKRMNDGLLDVRIIDGSEPRSRLHLLRAVLTGTLAGSRLYESRQTTELRVRCIDGPLRLSCDGEVFDGPEEFVIRKDPARVQVLVPPEDAAGGGAADGEQDGHNGSLRP